MKRTKPRQTEKPNDKVYTLKELKGILTEKQKNFCHEYISNGWNASKAARDAKYSIKAAKEQGSLLLTKTNIRQYIAFVKTDYEMLCGVSKAKQVQEYIKIAYSNIVHLHNTWIELKEFEEISDTDKEAIESIESKTQKVIQNKELKEVNYIKIKLYSKTTALDAINKLMGYNDAEKVELSGHVKKSIDISIYSDEEKKLLLKMARKTSHHGL